MSDEGQEITVHGLRLRKDKAVAYRTYKTSRGRMAEVRFFLDDEDGHDETAEIPQEIKT